jgi:hypothetical protein
MQEEIFLLREATMDDIDYATQGVNQFAPELARLYIALGLE